MTKEDILAILDTNASGSRSSMKIVIGVGIAMILGSIVMFLMMEERSNWTYVLGGVGAFFIFGAVRAIKTNMYEKKSQKIKDVFYMNPSDLVWSYELVMKGNIANTKQVIMKFRDGTQFEISDEDIPSKNCDDLVRGLTVINPKMIVGYSEETEKLYNAKQL